MTEEMDFDVVVIGGGIAGLVAANRALLTNGACCTGVEAISGEETIRFSAAT